LRLHKLIACKAFFSYLKLFKFLLILNFQANHMIWRNIDTYSCWCRLLL